MIDRKYVVPQLVWGTLIGCAISAELLLVPRGSRRRAIYSTLCFTIPLAMTGFVDGVSKQLGLVECSGGVALSSMLTVVMIGVMDRRIVNCESSLAMKCGNKQ